MQWWQILLIAFSVIVIVLVVFVSWGTSEDKSIDAEIRKLYIQALTANPEAITKWMKSNTRADENTIKNFLQGAVENENLYDSYHSHIKSFLDFAEELCGCTDEEIGSFIISMAQDSEDFSKVPPARLIEALEKFSKIKFLPSSKKDMVNQALVDLKAGKPLTKSTREIAHEALSYAAMAGVVIVATAIAEISGGSGAVTTTMSQHPHLVKGALNAFGLRKAMKKGVAWLDDKRIVFSMKSSFNELILSVCEMANVSMQGSRDEVFDKTVEFPVAWFRYLKDSHNKLQLHFSSRDTSTLVARLAMFANLPNRAIFEAESVNLRQQLNSVLGRPDWARALGLSFLFHLDLLPTDNSEVQNYFQLAQLNLVEFQVKGLSLQ